MEGDYSELLSSSIFCLVIPGDGWSARMDDATLHGCIPVIIMVGGCAAVLLAPCLSCLVCLCCISRLAACFPCLQVLTASWQRNSSLPHPPVPAALLLSCRPAQDNVHVSFESIIDLNEFALRIPQADAERLPAILQAVTQERREEMQRALGCVWQKYTYSSYLPYARRFREIQQQNAAGGAGAELVSDGGNSSSSSGGSKAAAPLSFPDTVHGLDPTADDAFGTLMAWLLHRIPATR